MPTAPHDELASPPEPSSTHSCEHSKARKTGAQLRDNQRSAKNDAKCVKKTIIAATVKSSTCLCCELECPPKIRDDLNLGFPLSRMITGTFTTVENRDDLWHLLLHTTDEQQLVQENSSCNCGISTVSHDFARICWNCTTRTSNT